MSRAVDPLRLRKYESHRAFLLDSGADPNERRLFHGTTADIISKILRQGFNRSFAGGRNGAVYGAGVYFARDAAYSAAPGYARPDSAGLRRVCLCDVLVGESARGAPGARVPPPRARATDPDDVCDSTVDDPVDPSVFVCYHDDQVRARLRGLAAARANPEGAEVGRGGERCGDGALHAGSRGRP